MASAFLTSHVDSCEQLHMNSAWLSRREETSMAGPEVAGRAASPLQ